MTDTPLSQKVAGSIKLSQELWYWDTNFKIFFTLAYSLIAATSLYAMWRGKWFKCRYSNREDEFKTYKRNQINSKLISTNDET